MYFCLSTAVLLATIFIPGTNTGWEWYRMIFYRGDDVMNTTFIPWGNLVYYVCMNIIGHWYVNCCNLNFHRKNICKTNSNRWLDMILVPIFAPIFFIFSSIMVLRADTDIASTGNGDYRYPWWNVLMFNALSW